MKKAIASALGISPSDISIKTIDVGNARWSLEVKIQTTAGGATAIQVKITSSDVNIQLVEYFKFNNLRYSFSIDRVFGCVKCTEVPNSAPVCVPCGE